MNELTETIIECPTAVSLLRCLINPETPAVHTIEDCQGVCKPITFVVTEANTTGDLSVAVYSEKRHLLRLKVRESKSCLNGGLQ